MHTEPAPRLRTVIVTGGASGIGWEIAKFYAADPSNYVYILDLNAELGARASTSLSDNVARANIKFKQCDIADWVSSEKVFEEIFLEQGNIGTVVANAGISERGDFLGSEEEEDKPMRPNLTTLDVNLIGTLYTIKLATFYIRKSQRSPSNESQLNGSIICTASVAGIYAFPTAPLYATTKHAIIGLVRSLARSLAQYGISINALAPNVIGMSVCISFEIRGMCDESKFLAVETNIAASAELFKGMILTPRTTLHRAMMELTSKPGLTGKVLLLSGEKVLYEEAPSFDGKEDIERNIEEFWRLGYS
ncbi:hypothetical protein AbraIFM66950_009642 [Aspergillus brasiliensis]|nr:hypothetical protein AbraIFM66950_009642 [Aspergillus brasiliensis]